jgi:hypothetical protein
MRDLCALRRHRCYTSIVAVVNKSFSDTFRPNIHDLPALRAQQSKYRRLCSANSSLRKIYGVSIRLFWNSGAGVASQNG